MLNPLLISTVFLMSEFFMCDIPPVITDSLAKQGEMDKTERKLPRSTTTFAILLFSSVSRCVSNTCLQYVMRMGDRARSGRRETLCSNIEKDSIAHQMKLIKMNTKLNFYYKFKSNTNSSVPSSAVRNRRPDPRFTESRFTIVNLSGF